MNYYICNNFVVGGKKYHYAFPSSIYDFSSFIDHLKVEGFVVIHSVYSKSQNITFYVACEPGAPVPCDVCFDNQNVIGFITEE